PSSSPLSSFFLPRSSAPRHLHSFPTRRSSDLPGFCRIGRADNAAPLGDRIVAFECDRHARPTRHKLNEAIIERPALVDFVKFRGDRKSTRLNSSHRTISYAVFCLKKKKKKKIN